MAEFLFAALFALAEPIIIIVIIVSVIRKSKRAAARNAPTRSADKVHYEKSPAVRAYEARKQMDTGGGSTPKRTNKDRYASADPDRNAKVRAVPRDIHTVDCHRRHYSCDPCENAASFSFFRSIKQAYDDPWNQPYKYESDR